MAAKLLPPAIFDGGNNHPIIDKHYYPLLSLTSNNDTASCRTQLRKQGALAATLLRCYKLHVASCKHFTAVNVLRQHFEACQCQVFTFITFIRVEC